MKGIIYFLIKLVFFWICLFEFQHSLFLAFNYSQINGLSFNEILLSYRYAFPMDMSAIGYLLIIPVILLIISLFLKHHSSLKKVLHTVNISLMIFCLLIGIVDAELYLNWGSKLNGKALSYIAFPAKAAASLSNIQYIFFSLLIIAQIAAVVYLYKKIAVLNFSERIPIIQKIVFIPVILFLVVFAFRGGLQTLPISKSWVYYSKSSVLNYAATNGFWNFMDIFANPLIKNNPYQYFTKEKALEIVEEMHTNKFDSTKYVLNTERPNIVFILLESVSAECMYKLGGLKGVMPKMDSLASEGLLYTNFYANGFRTEQGQIAILASFPAQPQTTIMRKFGKFEKLPSLTKVLDEHSYSINYYYSGNTQFANTETFLKSSGFKKILNEDNYAWSHRTDWGAYDEELFDCHLNEAEKDKQPFFSVIMTSTNHEPFDADVEQVFKGKTAADRYKNTVYYTDKCVWEYLEKAKSKPWYKNTLFVLMADHAHFYPFNRGANEAERHRIPMLFYGDVLNEKYRGKTISKIGSQVDFPAILLSQIKIEHAQFERSKNILNEGAPEFAYYTFDNGFGIVTKEQTLVYDHNLGDIVYRKNKLLPNIDSSIINQGKAYLQSSFDEYIGFNN